MDDWASSRVTVALSRLDHKSVRRSLLRAGRSLCALFRAAHPLSDDAQRDNSRLGFELWDDITEDGVFEIAKETTIHGTRPRSQQAAFTRLNSKDHLDLESYLKSRGLAYYLERYDIDLADAFGALKELELMNIYYLSLFPHLEGAALDAKRKGWIATHDLFDELKKSQSEGK